MLDNAILAALIATVIMLPFLFPPHDAQAVTAEGLSVPVGSEPDEQPTWRDYVMFKKGGGSAPAPDPNIGLAALKNADIGQQWKDFAEEQFKAGNIRQEALDDLNKRVIEQQLTTQDTSNQWAQGDRQRYETTFRPLEDMAVLDAYGASYMTDDQLRTFLGERNAAARTQLQADYEQRAASIRALATQKEVLNKAVQGILGGDNARKLAEMMLKAEGVAPPQEYTTESRIKGYQTGYTGSGDSDTTFQTPIYEDGPTRKNPQFAQQQAEYQSRIDELAKQLAGGGQTAQELVRKYTDQDIQTLLEAEQKKYEADLSRIGANEEAIFAQRQAERLAQDNAAAEAKADVSSSATQQRQATQRNMASMGLNPTSGRYQGVDRAMETATGLASAGAQTNARRGVTADNRASRANAINIGAGLPAAASSSFGLGLNAGNSATGNAMQGEGNWRSNIGIMGQGFGGAMQGYGNQANILQNQYQSQLSAWNAQQNANAASSAGLFGALGTGIGAYAAL